MKNYSYITVLSTENYLKGVLCLVKSLQKTNTKYPISILLTDNISKDTEKLLKKYSVNIIRKNKIQIPETIKIKNQKGTFEHWTNTFDKLQIFELTEFQKLIYLDSDMYVRKNIDELFEKENMSATIDRPTGPVFSDNYQLKLTSGLMVIEPTLGILQNFMDILMNIVDIRDFVGDQDILQEYDKHWREKTELHLDIKYNMFFPHLDYCTHYQDYSLEDLCVIHFILNKKPFHFSKEQIPQYLEWIETGKQKIYDKFKSLFPYDYIACGNDDEKIILQEYFDILESLELS